MAAVQETRSQIEQKPQIKARKKVRIAKQRKAEFERIRQSGRTGTGHPGIYRSKSMGSTTATGRERLLQLSQPKEPKSEWYTSVGPHLRWGTQEMIWPIKKESKEASPTERIVVLSNPKQNFLTGNNVTRPEFNYSCGRSSVIWGVGQGAKNARPTERVSLLAAHKQAHKDYKEDRTQFAYSCGRHSPIWGVNRQAMSCGDRPLTQQLAKHKEPHRDFQGEKPIQTIIPPHALRARSTERVNYLSTPKSRNEGPFREPTWEVPDSVKNASATARCLELARPKGIVDGYMLPREVEWPVSRAAKRATSTGRVEELSKPVVRATMDHVQFNPDAFLVKPLALKGSFPQRIEQLSRPIDR